MARNDSYSGSSGSTRVTRPTYLPPHFRDEMPERFNQSPRGGGGGRGGRTCSRGRGPLFHGRGRSTRPFFGGYNRPFNNVIEKNDEHEVVYNEDVEANNIDAYNDTQVKATGENIPPPVTSFSEIEFPEALMENIKRCKYLKPTPIQKYAIPVVMEGRDLMACAQTGSGKTAAFCFPIISRILKNRSSGSNGFEGGVDLEGYNYNYKIAFPLALILSPTRELSCQIFEEAKKFSQQTGVKVAVAYGGAPIVQQLRNLEKGVDILVATPGRLVDMIERAKVSLRKVKYLAVDEADRMLDMGFEPQIRRIVEQMEMPAPGARQTLLFSATFPDEIQKLSSDFLKDYIFLTAGRVGSSSDLIVQKIDFVHDTEKRSHLVNLLHAHRANGTHGWHALTLIFVETKKGADSLEHWLSMKGFPSIAIHGDKVQMERERALRSFKNGRTPIMVATDVASRGLDIPHVAHVINFDLPKDIADYVHRIGRTGRAGKSGFATAFFSDKNLPLARALVELMLEASQEVPEWLNQYADSSSYHRGGARSNNSYRTRKFGGHDFRSGAPLGNGNFNYPSQYIDSYSSKDVSAAERPAYTNLNSNAAAYSSNASMGYIHCTPSEGGYSEPSGSNYFAPPPYSCGYDYGTVCTGWD